MKTRTGSLPYKKNNIKRDKNNSTKVIIPLTRTRTFVLQRKSQYPIDATEKILRRKIQNSDLLTSWRLVLFQLICILRWQLVMHFWLPSNHPGANMLCGMEFNEFRPPNSSDDLCLLFCLFLLLWEWSLQLSHAACQSNMYKNTASYRRIGYKMYNQ